MDAQCRNSQGSSAANLPPNGKKWAHKNDMFVCQRSDVSMGFLSEGHGHIDHFLLMEGVGERGGGMVGCNGWGGVCFLLFFDTFFLCSSFTFAVFSLLPSCYRRLSGTMI